MFEPHFLEVEFVLVDFFGQRVAVSFDLLELGLEIVQE
jgi:hypothetical protein